MARLCRYKRPIFLAALCLLQSAPSNSQELRIDAVFALIGECIAYVNGADINCDGKGVYTHLQNGRQVVNFAGQAIATIGFAGRLDNYTNDMIWVDRVYLAQNQYEADGSCNLKLRADGPEAVECHAILKDGRKISGRMPSARVKKTNVRPSPNPHQANHCSSLVKLHAFLTRAQFQCGYRYYSNEMLEQAQQCKEMLADKETQRTIDDGVVLFDRREKNVGRRALCRVILRDFPTIVMK
jgi:hypothetical protein